MFKRGLAVVAAATAVVCGLSMRSSAAAIWSDDFNSNTSANYNTYITAGATGPSGDATFAYNYGADPSLRRVGDSCSPPHNRWLDDWHPHPRTDNLQSSVGTVVGAY